MARLHDPFTSRNACPLALTAAQNFADAQDMSFSLPEGSTRAGPCQDRPSYAKTLPLMSDARQNDAPGQEMLTSWGVEAKLRWLRSDPSPSAHTTPRVGLTGLSLPAAMQSRRVGQDTASGSPAKCWGWPHTPSA